MLHEATTSRILATFYEVANETGYGFLENVYEAAMEMALRDAGLAVERQRAVPVTFRGVTIADFRADLLIDDRVIVEVKAGRAVEPAHEAQLLNYLRASPFEVGLLLHFGPRASFRRLIYSNDRKRSVRARLAQASTN